MKKVININFQGRVIPIEETAYDILKQYVESLRIYFANEEGKDEIINDIEGRIAELFVETLKKGATCITDADINTIINSIGRPEEFDGEEAKVQSQLGAGSRQQSYTSYSEETTGTKTRHRLVRDENDKILGGVCAGLANYLRIDPAIIRILFAVITFGGFGSGFLIYILMWIILPSRTLDRGMIRKRLFRNPDDKVIAGVASGVASYFNIQTWIARLVFAFPLLLSIIISIFRNIFWNYDPAPSIIFGSFGGTFFIVYLILWIVIPEANSASEKLEMRGEKVDLNSIKNTIQEDLGQFKTKAEKWGTEFKDRAQEWGKEFGQTVGEKGQAFSNEVRTAARSGGSRLGHAIGIVFKAFFLFIAGVIAFALLTGLVTLMFGGVNFYPLKNFFLDGFWQNFLAWATLVLFLAIPVIALITWLIRRIMRVKSKNPYLGYIFGGLWTIGLICAIFLAASIARNYRSKNGINENVSIVQPAGNKVVVRVSDDAGHYYDTDWFGFDWDGDAPFFGVSEDSLMFRTVLVRIAKSDDSNFHTKLIKFSRGADPATAKSYASNINFNINQQDSAIILPRGFAVTKKNKYHTQQVLVIVEVPLNKKIEVDGSVNQYEWFDMYSGYNNRRRWDRDWNNAVNNTEGWNENTEYIMTAEGLKPTHQTEDDKAETDDKQQQIEDYKNQQKELKEKQQELEKSLQQDSSRYQYKPAPQKQAKPAKDSGNTAKSESLLHKLPINISTLFVERFTM